ncbi:YLP motif-containing protein 1 [Corchorus olitorius]|uniref:YLP motif-containing protein 1 n=1 Tax=Corchorus olitorius TaxID=93759 RepID=A0A1R3KPH8_9ROSI|nr:YLP motif-containing protein 1 [Corchorus olitorius]
MCPVCSIPHFPFCPPYPPYNYHNPNYPPHYDRPGFDPYQPPLPPIPLPPPPPPPPPPMVPNNPPPYFDGFPDAGSWHRNPNYGYGYGAVGCGGEVDRSCKRPRVDEFGMGPGSGPGPGPVFLADERRLKLVRDHGGVSLSGFDQEHKYFQNNVNNNNNRANPMPPRSSEMYKIEDSLNNLNSQQQIQHKDSASTPVKYRQGYEQKQHGGHNMAQPPPPLPASPPPPLPVEPPMQHHPQVIHRISPKQLSSDKPKLVDASKLFKIPHRASRPDHIVIILRGLPGSGKSYLAKMLRDLEVEYGGDAPRIHSMDDYFMTEVEKDGETDSKSASSARSKKTMKKMVMEYCYEPEMEEAYRESMLKAFKRTLEDGSFSFVIVDDRNLRVADFAQFWAIGKVIALLSALGFFFVDLEQRSGYEVYILEATYKDPAGCAARNVHGFTLDDVQQMAGQWEEAPALYLQLDIKSLFHGDDLKESGIQEVDMDMEDGDRDEGLSEQQEQKPEKMKLRAIGNHVSEDSSKDEKRSDAEGDHPPEVNGLSRSKWSNDLDEDETEGAEALKGNLSALSGLIQAYGKQSKSVHWSDQVHAYIYDKVANLNFDEILGKVHLFLPFVVCWGGDTGFSIGAAKKAKLLSLVIGPGAGYNLKSNPLPKEESHASSSNLKQSSFQDRLRAERESFKAVFDRRKRIGGLDAGEE